MTESFDDVLITIRKYRLLSGKMYNRLKKAHNHELEHLRRSRFREGYEAGRRSMDAEHYSVALRLKHLPLDEDSHGNLSQIARAVWHSDFGWTKGACAALRDELVRLLGGVHDEPEPIPASSCACDADCDCGHGDETAVRITNELRKFKGHINGGLTPEMVLAMRAEIDCIADRIDEQFDRGCKLWERTATDKALEVYESMVAERDKLVDNRDMWRGKAMQLTDVVDRYVGRCEDLLDLLRDAAVDFKNASYSWDYALIVGENITIETERNRLLKERDELRKSLREIAERVGVPHDVDLDEYSDDLVAKATLGKIDSTHEYIGALEWQRDRQRKLLDEYENADTPEEIVRDIHLGKVTDSEAVERIRALR